MEPRRGQRDRGTSIGMQPDGKAGSDDALRLAFDAMEEGLFVFDAKGGLVLENPAGTRLRDGGLGGEQPARPMTSPTGDGLPPEPSVLAGPDVELPLEVALERVVREVLAKRGTLEQTLTHRSRILLARARPLSSSRVLVSVRDVTDDRGREVRRLQSEKLASIGMMAAGVAHEINNPVLFVLANIDALAGVLRLIEEKMGAAPELARRLGLRDLLFEAMGVLQESKEGMARIHRIVRDLHSFSRVEDDPSALTDVNAAVESALTMLRNELKYRATIERHLRAKRAVRASTARLGQVFLNLIINAAHAMADGSPNRNRLWVRSYDEGHKVVVEIEDNGPGIAPEVMPQIFDSFFTTKAPGVGTGLGLPISRDIICSLGGEITAVSEPGQGARFVVSLPAAEESQLAAPRTTPAPQPVPRPGLRRYRILAVDDEALLLKAYRRMLIDYHDVDVRVGARDALALLEGDRSWDIVLCDLQMPEMSGADLYEIVKQRWPELAQRFIFITGGAFAPDARKFLEESAPPACINKPFYVNELLELMDKRVQAVRSA